MGPSGKVTCKSIVQMDYNGYKYLVCGGNSAACGKSDECFDVEAYRKAHTPVEY